MKTWVKILLAIILLVVVGSIAALFILDSQYQFLRDAPRISHETLAQPDTSIRIVAQPPLAKDIIKTVLGNQAPSDWVLEKALPYEVALLITPHLDTGKIDIDLFCNDRRLGPVIADQSSQLALQSAYPFIHWDSDRFNETSRGSLVWHGTADIKSSVVDNVRMHWGDVSQLSRPRAKGGHLVEAVIDNRDGSLFTLIATLQADGQIVLPVSLEDVAKSLLTVADARITADLDGPDTLSVDMAVDCVPQAQPGEITATSFLIGGILNQISQILEQNYKVSFEGTKKTEGTAILSTYKLTPLSRLLQAR